MIPVQLVMYELCPQSEAVELSAPESNVTDTEAPGEEERGTCKSHLNGSDSSKDRTDPLLPHAQPEGTHGGANEEQTRCTYCIPTRFNRYKEIFFNHWKICILAGVLVCLVPVVVVPVSVLFSNTEKTSNGNTTLNISRELSPNSSFSLEELDWKSCNGVNVNISNQELSFKGSKDHCAKYQARLLDMNSAKTIQDCIMDKADYWVGQNCELMNNSTCEVFNKIKCEQLHPSTMRRFICTK
ncbi:uncharacterized protein LOC108717257 [Xenopus laevis]|uniref:Uncharacterized protein LOC108717257 n=2 Tax=Xenopus laevis TaxID=8355 RepID=A0A1L8GCG8_XENLA|nr:uncharacterized protein LOC108717257 [Xenopus laevis]OCT81471.1 hypothetical protein XELAEV_18028291mg [Xenopus laevis]